MKPLVSVVVPIYNVSLYLHECVDSIVNQTYDEIEIILVDDGSTDDCGAICDHYAEKYDNILVIHQKNSGLGMARNSGIRKAKGDFIAFIDGDDFVSPTHIMDMVKTILNDRSDVCYGGYNQQVRNKYVAMVNPCSGKIYFGEDILSSIIPRMCGRLNYSTHDEIAMSVCMALYSMNVIRNNNLFFRSEREVISEDLAFNIEFLKCVNSASVTNLCGYYYRMNYNSLTKQYRRDRLKKQISMTEYAIKKTSEIGIYEKSSQRIYSTFLSWVRHIVKSEQRNYKNVGFIESTKRIRNVCCNSYVQDIIDKYDTKNLTFMPKVLNFLIKKKYAILIWIICFYKNMKIDFHY